MGKHSKNIKKNRQGHKAAEEKQAVKQYLSRIKMEMEDGEYAQVIETLAEMIEKKYIEPEAMYCGAYSYYMLNDYKRATDWVDNVLRYAPNHLQARLLLAKICELEERWSDVFAIYEMILENWMGKLSADDQEEIKDMMDEAEQEEISFDAQKYPYLANFCSPAPQPVFKVEIKETKVDPPAEVKDQFPSAEENRDKVLASGISLQEKVRLLNVFAAGYFLEKDYADAELLLQAALQIDSSSNETLRNMIILQNDMGNTETRDKLMAKLLVPDFLLLAHVNKS